MKRDNIHISYGLTLAAVLGAVSMSMGCADGVKLSAQQSQVHAQVDEMYDRAYRCAPRELALASAHEEFGRMELSDGNGRRGEEHIEFAVEKAKEADEKSLDVRCQDVKLQDRDKDGIVDKEDLCPDTPGIREFKGCPSPDPDHDGVCDPWVSEQGLHEKYKDVCRGVDKCPDEPETINGYKDDDGCPDKGRQVVFVLEDKIDIRDKIYFDNNKSSIKKKSYKLLDQVAQTLLANPKITKVIVEGHTDSTGSYEHNLELSRGRAQAVVDYLVSKGISSDRLTAVGYGPDRPVDPSNTKKAHAINRRVEFVIAEKK